MTAGTMRFRPRTIRAGPATGSDRVTRGGSWCGTTGDCRSADRVHVSPGNLGSDMGLRVCLVPAEK